MARFRFSHSRLSPSPEAQEADWHIEVDRGIEQRRCQLIRFALSVLEMRASGGKELFEEVSAKHGILLTNIDRNKKMAAIHKELREGANTFAHFIEISFQQCDEDEQALLQSSYEQSSQQGRTGQGLALSVEARQHLKADR